jgi:sugar lactone lactonase YvrE
VITDVVQPPGTTASAVLSGPSGSGYAEYAPPGVDTVTLLPVGPYTMSAAVATASDPIVTPFYAGVVTGTPAGDEIGDTSYTITLNDGDTSYMNATFTVLPGTGRAWIGSTNGSSSTASGYTSTQLTTNAAASITLAVAGSYEAFDLASDLCVADSAGNTITEYLAASLATGGTPAAAVTITSSGLSGPVGLSFDGAGNLWVANSTGNTVVGFAPSQLAAGGSMAPATTLSGSAFDLPGRISFDPYGNLWVPNTGSNTVVALVPAQLDASGAPTPSVTLSGSSLASPRAVAFDQHGDLWVTNSGNNTIVEFGNAQQDASGSPTPIEILTVPAAYAGPSAFAFDNSGDLWAITTATSAIIEYTAQEISAGAANDPSYVIQAPAKAVSLAFDPPPNGLPLVGPQSAKRLKGPTAAQGKTGVVRVR